MGQDLLNWLSGRTGQAVLWSLCSILLTLVVYLLVRRRIRAAQGRENMPKRSPRLLGLGILLVLLFVLIRIWATAIAGDVGDEPTSRIRALVENVIWTFGLAAVTYMLVAAARHGLIKRSASIEIRHKVRLATAWIGILMFLVGLAFIWVRGIQDFGLFLGLLGAGLALSLQETLVCVAGWLLLIVRRPYDIGDRIEIDGRVGDVIGISVFQTSMLEVGNWIKADQSTGRMLIIPNSMIIRHAVYNYTKGFPFVWDEFSAIVTFESDWQEAERLMLAKAEVEAEKMEGEVKRQIEQMQQRYAIHYEQLRPIVYTNIADNGVRLTLRYLTPARMRRTVNHRISRNVLQELVEHPRIDFAYPTTRMFRNSEEGKSALGGPRKDGLGEA